MSNTDFNPDESADFGGASPAISLPTGTGAQAPVSGTPLSQQWTKLGIINEALTNTANNTVALPDNQATPEWTAASSVYDQWLGLTLARRDWKFASVIAGCARIGPSPFPGYADIFAKPADCLQLVNCWRADLAALIQPASFGLPSEEYDTMAPPLDYEVIGDQIHTTVTDFLAPPGAANTDLPPGSTADFNDDFSSDFSNQALLYCQYIPFPKQGGAFSILFMAALRLKVEAGLFRALNEDFSEANRCDKEAEIALEEAAARSDGETPRRVAFRSSLIERRRRPRFGRFAGGGG